MSLQLTNQTVAILGASRGIGRAIAEAFSAEGCRLGLFDREPAAEPLPGTALFHAGDVTSLESVQAFAAELGPVDHMVYAVGIGSGKFGFPFWNVPPSDWARVLNVNLIGAVNAAHAFAPGLIAKGGGSVLLIASRGGANGFPNRSPL